MGRLLVNIVPKAQPGDLPKEAWGRIRDLEIVLGFEPETVVGARRLAPLSYELE